MLAQYIKVSVANVMLTIINADEVIARREIEGFAHLRKKYAINFSDIYDSSNK